MKSILRRISIQTLIRVLSLLRIPLLGLLFPSAKLIKGERAEVIVPFNFLTKNHLRSMYFGALAMGAELSIALAAIEEIRQHDTVVDFIFKDFAIEFIKRADGPVLMVCEEVPKVIELIQKARIETSRQEQKFFGYGVLKDKPEVRLVTFSLTLSVKKRG